MYHEIEEHRGLQTPTVEKLEPGHKALSLNPFDIQTVTSRSWPPFGPTTSRMNLAIIWLTTSPVKMGTCNERRDCQEMNGERLHCPQKGAAKLDRSWVLARVCTLKCPHRLDRRHFKQLPAEPESSIFMQDCGSKIRARDTLNSELPVEPERSIFMQDC